MTPRSFLVMELYVVVLKHRKRATLGRLIYFQNYLLFKYKTRVPRKSPFFYEKHIRPEFEKFLREEGVEWVIGLSDAGIAGHLAVWLNAVLQAVELPAGIPHLHACLPNVDWDALPHFLDQRKYNSPEANPKIAASY